MKITEIITESKDAFWEEINPETIAPGFKSEKWIMGKYLMTVNSHQNQYNPTLKSIVIRVYDPKATSPWLKKNGIAIAKFLVHGRHMESSFTSVDRDYQRQGISSAMYQYARELGNEIRPSRAQSKDAKAFWAAGAGVGKEFPYHKKDDEPIPVKMPEPKKSSWFNRILGRKG